MIALVYDVHGNLPALEAVLADAEAAGAQQYVLGGDFSLFGAWPQETVDRLRRVSGALWIRGNGERWTAFPAAAPEDSLVQAAIADCAASLGQETVAELAALPKEVQLRGTRFCHGSPVSDTRSFSPEADEHDAELLAGLAEGRLVFGHTHLPFARHAGEVELINPGSVGMPFDGIPRASYALMHDEGVVEHRRLEYDHAASAAELRLRHPDAAWAQTAAGRIQRAAF